MMSGDMTVSIFVIHGTNDGGGDPLEPHADGAAPTAIKWWRREGEFLTKLDRRLRVSEGSEGPEFHEFIWSGLNSQQARETAAGALAKAFQSARAAGSSIHVLAHSHGGNVARDAIVQLAHEGGLEAIGSVITFGTPYFRYSLFPRLLSSGLRSAAAIALIAGALIWLKPFGVTLDRMEQLLPALGVIGLSVAVVTLGLSLGTGGVTHLLGNLRWWAGAQKVRKAPRPWVNFYSTRDEAIQLLRSFNTPIKLMRRRRLEPGVFPFPAPLIVALLAIWLGVGVFFFHLLTEVVTPRWHGPLFRFQKVPEVLQPFALQVGIFIISTMASTMIFAVAVIAIGFALRAIRELWHFRLDVMISNQLRRIACGADGALQIASVDCVPWPGVGEATELPEALDAEMEAHVGAHAQLFWSRARARILPDVAYGEQDLLGAVGGALTWEELAHTTYVKFDGFVDLVADRLCQTADFRPRE